jgi:predicted Zn-dependent protease
MLSREKSKEILSKVVNFSDNHVNAMVTSAENATTRFANSEISQNVVVNTASLSVTVYRGKKKAASSTNVLSDEGIKAAVKEAEEMLDFVPEVEYEAFPIPHEPIPEKPINGALAKAFDIKGRAATIKEGMSLVESGFYAAGALNMSLSSIALADSAGGMRYVSNEEVDFNTVVTHADGSAGSGACLSYNAPPDITAQFRKAQETAKAARNPIPPELGAHTVVLSPSAFGDLVGFMGWMLNAKALDDGISFAVGKIGQKVFGENFTLRDACDHPDLRFFPFDYEGNTRKPLTLIDKGVVANVLYDNVLAKRHNTTSTGHGFSYGNGGYPFHLLVESGEKSIEEIIKSTEKGIFINEFHYTNFVNPRTLQITGLTRNGAFLIENGTLTKPMATVRFTESLLDAFCAITAVSKEQELIGSRSAMLMPGVKIEGFHFTSKP